MAESFWQRFWDRAPRQLRFTRAGRVLVGIALAAGLAAMNTGNNLLFFGWGMVLSAIVVSGVLSEASLRVLAGLADQPEVCRALEICYLPITVRNGSQRMPAYAVEVLAEVRGPTAVATAPGPYQLRIPPNAGNGLFATFTPRARGRYRVAQLVATTAYPFGFFEKSRRLRLNRELSFWCVPRAVDVGSLQRAVQARIGEAPLPRAGVGEDFFSLRPYRAGDDMRRVAWRRSARAGRWVVIETEAVAGRELVLELHLRPEAGHDPVEDAIATLGSLAESLIGLGYRVGVRAPGVLMHPEGGPRQRTEVLLALARLDPTSPMPAPPWSQRMARIALTGPAAAAPSGDGGVTLLAMASERSAA